MKETKRKGFNFFRSYFDVYNELENAEDKVAFIDALLDRQFMGVKPTELKGMAKFAYISQTNSIDSQIKGYNDKAKQLGNPLLGVNIDPYAGGKTTPTVQVQVEGQEKGKVEVQGKEETKPKIPKEFSEAVRDCFVNCLDFFPDHYKPKNQKITNQWMDTIHKLNTIEQIPFESIEQITKWAREGWWAKNFQSLLKLRKKNSDGIMYLSIFNDGMSAKPVSKGKSTAESRAEINRRIIEDLKNV